MLLSDCHLGHALPTCFDFIPRNYGLLPFKRGKKIIQSSNFRSRFFPRIVSLVVLNAVFFWQPPTKLLAENPKNVAQLPIFFLFLSKEKGFSRFVSRRTLGRPALIVSQKHKTSHFKLESKNKNWKFFKEKPFYPRIVPLVVVNVGLNSLTKLKDEKFFYPNFFRISFQKFLLKLPFWTCG